MSDVRDLRKMVSDLRAAYDAHRQICGPDAWPFMVTSDGRPIALEALTALVNAQTALVAAELRECARDLPRGQR